MEELQLKAEIYDRPRRGWRRWRRPIVPIGLAIFAAVMAIQLGGRGSDRISCERAIRGGDYGLAIVSCRTEYEQTGDPRTGARLADALYRAKDYAFAASVALPLLITPVRADVLLVLGKVATEQDRFGDAERFLRLAAEQHGKEERWSQVATDWLALGRIAKDRGEFVKALEALNLCVSEAKRAGDGGVTEGYCQLAIAQVLSRIGHPRGADDALKQAEKTMAAGVHLRWLHVVSGDVLQERGDHNQAVDSFDRALKLSKLPRDVLSAQLNLASSLIETRRFDEAARRLEEARVLDQDNRELPHRLLREARLALRRGEPGRAAELAEQAHAGLRSDSHDEQRDLDELRAELALERGDLEAAERHARSAVVHVQQLRAKQPAIQLRSWLETKRRASFELLFASLALRGDAGGALVVLEQWQGRAVLDSLASGPFGPVAREPRTFPRPPAPEPRASAGASTAPADDPRRVILQLQALTKLLPPLETSALATPARDGEILAAVRGAALVALVVARGDLWRISSERGQLRLTKLGAASALKRQLDEFHAHPGDALLAGALGELLVPRELARATGQVLHVVLDESVRELPVAALQVEGRSLISLRPIVRSVRPSDVACVRRSDGPRRIVVLADASRDLPGAQREAAELARRFSATVAVGADATKQALFAAEPRDLLHLAVHTEADDLGGVLVLGDGRVSALEVAGHGRAPSQVVLAGCNSAVASTGTYSMAMAFLAAGADQVVATLRPVSDDGAAQLTHRLYREDAIDLVRGLARVQAAGERDDEEWSKFVVFGREICTATP